MTCAECRFRGSGLRRICDNGIIPLRFFHICLSGSLTERKFTDMRFFAGMLAFLMLFIPSLSAGSAESAAADHPVVVLRVADYGDIYLELYPELAPVTVENFLGLVDSGFYNGLTFHRIISGFMAQGGCPLGNGTGSSGKNIKGEFSSNGVDNPLKHERGVLSMARSGDPDSASCQFFIMHADASHLDGSYAAFGRVLSGMGIVDAICLNAHVTDSNGTVPREDQPVITEAARAERGEAEAASAREAENGSEGGVFDDPVSGLSFPLPEGWRLQSCANGSALFTDGAAVFSLSSKDVWRQLGKSGQEQFAAAGYTRDRLTTEALNRASFAASAGLSEDQLKEETVNGSLWLAAATEKNGEATQYHAGAVNGTVIILAGSEDAAQAMEAVLSSLTVE